MFHLSKYLDQPNLMMPLMDYSHFPNQFFQTLQQFRESRYLCDVRLIADGEIEFSAHRLVLAVSSPFFSDLFQSKKDTQNVTTVHLRNCSADSIRILLQFLYTGELQLHDCDPTQVLSVARACRIGALENVLLNYANPNSKQTLASAESNMDESGSQSVASNVKKGKSVSTGINETIQTKEGGKMFNKTSSVSSQQQHTPSSFDSSIFMQNIQPPFCPIHGIFSCGCSLFAMGPNRSRPLSNDPTLAAAFQQLIFGAAAAAAAAAGSAQTSINTDDQIPKIGRMGIKGENGLSQLFSVGQNGQLPSTVAQTQDDSMTSNSPTTTHFSSKSPAMGTFSTKSATAQFSAKSPATGTKFSLTGYFNPDSTNSPADTTFHKSSPDRPDKIMDLDTDAPKQHNGHRIGALNMVQVPADDKEGWCRNKKYIKKTAQGYQCSVCKKTYGRYNSVSYHVTIYHRNPPIQCDQPGCTFSTREARYIHFHKYYRHDVPLPANIDLHSRRCPFCRHVSKSPAMLEKHINRHMPDSVRIGRTYHCELCKIHLSNRQALIQHMIEHENEKCLSCDQCSYRGRTVESVQQHKLFKHGSGDLWCTKFQCDQCQFSAPSKSQLITHQGNVHGKTEANSDMESDEGRDSLIGSKLTIAGEEGMKEESEIDEEIGMDGLDEIEDDQVNLKTEII